ncbi:MAG TPA: hypothetical protein VGY58_22305, partial [Gemmataceae bacterium]|nr:hypothetical protein [Gemmataceae bacterium]
RALGLSSSSSSGSRALPFRAGVPHERRGKSFTRQVHYQQPTYLGIIHPVEPLPADWKEGQELEVQKVQEDSLQDLDQWYEELEAMVTENDPADIAELEATLQEADARLQAALEERHREAKQVMRRRADLS